MGTTPARKVFPRATVPLHVISSDWKILLARKLAKKGKGAVNFNPLALSALNKLSLGTITLDGAARLMVYLPGDDLDIRIVAIGVPAGVEIVTSNVLVSRVDKYM